MSPLPESEIRSRFAVRRRIRFLSAALVVGTFGSFRFGLDETKQELFGIGQPFAAAVFMVAIGTAIVVQYGLWRCPSCSGYLGRSMSPKFCSRCGASLRDS